MQIGYIECTSFDGLLLIPEVALNNKKLSFAPSDKVKNAELILYRILA